MKLAVVVILSMTMLMTLFSARLERWKITMPMAMVFAGALVGWGTSVPIIEAMGNPSAERAVEIVLALLLFLDATQVKKLRRRTTGLLVRLVLLGVPLCLFVATVAAGMFFPHERLVVCLILACIIVPTDMAPAARVLTDRRIPARLRNLLNTESGYNDGVVAPIFLFATQLLETKDENSGAEALADMVPAAAYAILVGVIIGAATAFAAKQALARKLTTEASMGLIIVATPLLAYTCAGGLAANGFVAAFVAGLLFRSVFGPIDHSMLSFGEGVASFVVMPLWFIIGQLFTLAIDFEGQRWRAFVLAMLGLTVLRVIPILLVLLFSRTTWTQRLVIGWLGPRGIASVVFALLAIPAMENDAQVELVIQVLAFTVVGSVVLHGLSATFVPAWLERAGHVDEDAETPHVAGPSDDVAPVAARPDGRTGATRYEG